MSDTAKQLFDGLKELKSVALAIAPGLSNIGGELKAEGNRLFTQGTMEIASALFNGNAFVPYGPGQYTQTVEPSLEHSPAPELQREGMER